MIRSKVILAILLQTIIYVNVKASPYNRIINGEIAHKYQFPWHVSLEITLNDSTHPRYCGGSLISRQFILTAAWCLRNAQKVHISMGSIIFLDPLQTQESTQFISHSQYNAELNINNIGIIRLSHEVEEYSNTQRAILITGVRQEHELYINVTSYISGFGVYELGMDEICDLGITKLFYLPLGSIGGNSLSNNLRFAEQLTLSNQECHQSFDPRFVPSSAICARGNDTRTACFGDIGSPLVIQYQDTWMQIGIASMIHPSGCAGDLTVLYTRLTSHIEWIRSMTGIIVDF